MARRTSAEDVVRDLKYQGRVLHDRLKSPGDDAVARMDEMVDARTARALGVMRSCQPRDDVFEVVEGAKTAAGRS
ncbi:MAG: hypothetical protein BGO49_04485 [Planctomycetales bacterium 71-10]|nr:MAG: hypothetical protein BGO49_04485 [Planctomycetales bacterium 71-10]